MDLTGYDLRPATGADVPGIVALYTSLSESSTRMRFSSLMPDDLLRDIAQLTDGTRAEVAVLDGTVVGEARYEPVEDGMHEFGLTIQDGHQHRGLGRVLLERLRETALEHGITSLRAVVRVDNLPMLKMLRHEQCAVVQPARGGEVVLDVACDDAMPGWPVRTARPRVLVEARGLAEDPLSTALRTAGFEVRRCNGPLAGGGHPCPLVSHGRCRLAEEADYVACLLPETDPDCRDVADEHARHRPERLVATSQAEWREAAPALLQP